MTNRHLAFALCLICFISVFNFCFYISRPFARMNVDCFWGVTSCLINYFLKLFWGRHKYVGVCHRCIKMKDMLVPKEPLWYLEDWQYLHQQTVLGHGTSPHRLRSEGLRSLPRETHRVHYSVAVADYEMCGEFQKATVSITPPRTETSLDGATLYLCNSNRGVQAVSRFPKLVCIVIWTCSCR